MIQNSGESSTMTDKIKYQCIECGASISSLYTDYKAGSIKISHCQKCGSVADKYVEYDPVIIFLDAMLLQPQPYRHLLINTQFQSHWRLALILWVCDAFVKLVIHRSGLVGNQIHHLPDGASRGQRYTYLGLELELYLNYIVAASELLALLISVHAVLLLRNLVEKHKTSSSQIFLTNKAIIVASLGRVLAVPALLWGQSLSYLYVWISHGFVFLSTWQALRVVVCEGRRTMLWTTVAVLVGFITQTAISHALHSWIEKYSVS